MKFKLINIIINGDIFNEFIYNIVLFCICILIFGEEIFMLFLFYSELFLKIVLNGILMIWVFVYILVNKFFFICNIFFLKNVLVENVYLIVNVGILFIKLLINV